MIKNLIQPSVRLPKFSVALVSIVVLYSSLSLLPDKLGGKIAYADEQKAKQAIQSIKVPAMRNRVYSQLARAQKLADEGFGLAGFKVLDEVKDRIDSLNSYERAMLWNFYGFMHYANEDVTLAINSFKKVIDEKSIPISLRASTLYSMAQLFMQQENYRQTLDYLTLWQSVNTKLLTGNQHVMFAQAHYQNKQYQQSLMSVSNAIIQAEKANEIPKENWLILQRANYFELKQPKQVIKVIENLVRYYDKPKYWLQLGGMYGDTGEEDKQLAVMESAWQAGYLTKSADIISLVQLYRYHGVPYKAAKLLEASMEQGSIVPEERYLDMLAQAYIAARDDDRAIPVLIKASNISDSGKFDALLAETYLNLEQWQLAINAAELAIERGDIDRLGNMYLVKGMAFFNLSRFQPSLLAFTHAKEIPESNKTAKHWYNYVVGEQGTQERLAMLN